MKTKTTVRDYADGALVRETITERDVCTCNSRTLTLDHRALAKAVAVGTARNARR